LSKHFSLSYIFSITSDNILSCRMVILQCTPPMGHVVTFHFQKKVYAV